MSHVSRTPEGDARLFHECAEAGMLPLVSPCPNGCRFCYEHHLHRLYAGVRVPHVPAPTGALLEGFWATAAEHPQPLQAGISLSVRDGAVQYYNWSDFFSQGLGLEDVERLLKHNAAFRYPTWLHTNARDLTTEWARHLSARFPETLRLHLSVATLNDALKKTLVAGWDDTDKLTQIIGVVRDAKLYLIHVNAEQTLADLRAINTCANRAAPPMVVIARLHHHRLHPPDIRQLSLEGGAQERAAVELLVRHRAELENIADVFLYFPSATYAWTARAFLRGQLRPFALGPSDLVVCSEGAFEVMRRFVAYGGARVVTVADPLGGSTDFTTTLTTAGITAAVRQQLAQGPPLRRLFVPASVWWIEDRYCLDGGTLDDLRTALPQLEITAVPIPLTIRRRRLTLHEAHDFLHVDLELTAALHADAATRASALRACLDPFEELTAAGYIRRVSVDLRGRAADESESLVRGLPPETWTWADGRLEIVLDARRLPEVGWGDVPVTLTYVEPVLTTTHDGQDPRGRRLGLGEGAVDLRRDVVFSTTLEHAVERRCLWLLVDCGWEIAEARRRLGLEDGQETLSDEVREVLGHAEVLHHRCAHVERSSPCV